MNILKFDLSDLTSTRANKLQVNEREKASAKMGEVQADLDFDGGNKKCLAVFKNGIFIEIEIW